MYSNDELLPLSALQHLLFCERQCALIHLERLWAENRLTVEGGHLHKKAHQGRDESCDGAWIARGLNLCSYRLGLIGKADVVEFVPPQGQHQPLLHELLATHSRLPDGWQVTPIEYKRGRPKADDSDRVQLCAQALCLEEMRGLPIAEGALFYGKRRRRTIVRFDPALRERTVIATQRLHELIAARRTPPAVREPKCDNCSLLNLCLPQALRPGGSVQRFIERQFSHHLASDAPSVDAFDETPP